jgi:hypothetical protein
LAKKQYLNSVITDYMRANKEINYRYIVKPDSAIEWEIELVSFDPKRSQKLIEEGKEKAKEVLAQGPGVAFGQLISDK